jgi:hypothetical protein
MNRHSRTALFTAAILTLAGSSLAAQERPRHDRFWFAFGLGGGWNTFNVDLEPTTRRWHIDFDGPRGAAGYFRLGGTVNQHVLFGGEALIFWRENDNEIQRANVTASALIYPGSHGGLFFKGGFGVAAYEDHGREESGVGTTLGAGFDFRIGRNMFVTPNVDFMLQLFEEHTSGSLLFTLGFTWH